MQVQFVALETGSGASCTQARENIRLLRHMGITHGREDMEMVKMDMTSDFEGCAPLRDCSKQGMQLLARSTAEKLSLRLGTNI